VYNQVEFIEDYAEALAPINYVIKDYKPDYILALIRKGPRLIELMKLAALWDIETPIITERALDFIPVNELRGKKILVFDDIIISGTTIHNIFKKLPLKYGPREIKMLCVAVDKDTYCKEAMPQNFRNMIELSRDERFTFSNQLVRAFLFLNKPYDLDYCIFYTNIPNEKISYLLSNTTLLEKAYDLTTRYQESKGFLRYSFIPNDTKFSRFFVKYFNNFPIKPEICKVRVYLNQSDGKAAITPIVTFSMDKKSCSPKYTYFNHNFDFFNDLIKELENFSDNSDRRLPTFKLLWYILSYLYGLSFNLRISTDNFKLIPSTYPSQMLDFQDLCFIFGPTFSKRIIIFLDDHFLETIQGLNKLHEDFFNVSDEEIKDIKIESKELSTIFDKRRWDLYQEIRSYIKNNVNENKELPDNMATIFEALYNKKELPMQKKIIKYGIEGIEHKRLNIGFNLNQIKNILENEKLKFSEIELSASIDFVVDIGTQIPIFYDENDSDLFERAYRHGEDAFSGKLFEYIISNVTKELFSYIHEKGGESILPKIPFEKIGVMIYNKIEESGFKQTLRYPQGISNDRDITILPMFYRHGAILSISDAAKYSTHTSWQFFCDWCKSVGIIKYKSNNKMVMYNDVWSNKNVIDPKLPKLVSDEMMTEFENLAAILYHVDRKIDTKHNSDYLIALTTCKNDKFFLEALQAELKLFFKSNWYSISVTLHQLRVLIREDPEHRSGNYTNVLKNFKNRSYHVAHSVRHKKRLFYTITSTIHEIESHFLNCNFELRNLYKSSLAKYLGNIRRINEVQKDIAVKDFENKTLILGELCIGLSELLRSILELASNSERATKSKGGRIKDSDFGKLKISCQKYYDAINTWNGFIEENAYMTFYGYIIKDLKINSTIIIEPNHYNLDMYNALIVNAFSQIENIYSRFDRIYDSNFSDSIFANELNRLFPWMDHINNDLEAQPWKWILLYDIKDFSGGRNPDNKRKGPLLVKHINEMLDIVQSSVNDGFFPRFDENDGKYILIEKQENVSIYINELFKCTKNYNMFIKISLCHTSDTNETFKTYKKDKRLAGTELHILSERLCCYFKDRNKEEDSNHSLFMTLPCFELLWNKEIPSNLYNEWEIIDAKLHYEILRGISKYVGFYAIKIELKGSLAERSSSNELKSEIKV
jgi:hypothetical protein